MRKNVFLVRFGEIWLKSERTRRRLIAMLEQDISRRLSDEGIKARIYSIRGRIVVDPEDGWEQREKIKRVLERIFGIVSFSPAIMVDTRLEDIEEVVLQFAEKIDGTFKLEVNRADKRFPITSMELAKRLGGRLVEMGKRVDLKRPKHIIGVDIRQEASFVFMEEFAGPGGLPYGSQGRVLALFSGGIDSPVAAWYITKRGCEVDLLFVNMFDESLEKRVYDTYFTLKDWLPGAKLFVARIPELRGVLAKIKEGYRQIAYKRFIYGLAEEFAMKIGADAIVTGESLGQVSSQTLKSLVAIEDKVKMPVFRPLIGFDKHETMKIARKIGCLGPSERVPEVCRMETHSITNISLDVARKLDNEMPDPRGFLDRIIEAKTAKDLFFDKESMEGYEIIHYPFDKKLDKGKKYIFVCKSGLEASLAASKAREKGIEAYYLDEATFMKRNTGTKGGPSENSLE